MPRQTDTRTVEALGREIHRFVFKIQANMDPKHRDRVAFYARGFRPEVMRRAAKLRGCDFRRVNFYGGRPFAR